MNTRVQTFYSFKYIIHYENYIELSDPFIFLRRNSLYIKYVATDESYTDAQRCISTNSAIT